FLAIGRVFEPGCEGSLRSVDLLRYLNTRLRLLDGHHDLFRLWQRTVFAGGDVEIPDTVKVGRGLRNRHHEQEQNTSQYGSRHDLASIAPLYNDHPCEDS